MKVIVLVLLKLSVLSLSESARILAVFPAPYLSHQMVFRPLTKELARRGHDVVVITTDPINEDIENLTEIDVHNVSYTLKNDCTLKYTGDDGLYELVKNFFDLFVKVFEVQLNTDEVQTLINDKNQQFDLIIAEEIIRPALVFSHIYKAPAICISSLGSIDAFTESLGVPTHPILYPSLTRSKLMNLNLLDKVKELMRHYIVQHVIHMQEIEEDKLLKKYFGPDVPLLRDLKKNIALLLRNLHRIWENNRPVPPNVIYLGGLHLASKTNSILPENLERYLNSSKNGVVYVSFGSHLKLSHLPEKKLEIFLKSLSKIPYDVLLKSDEDELPVNSTNIRTFKWLPQAVLLKHPSIKLFITQAGLQSTDEAIAAGVPLLGIPLVADQSYNAEQYVRFKIGLKLDVRKVNEEDILSAVDIVISDKSYRENIIKFRSLIYDQPQSCLDRAVWWIEHVLRHGGGSHLLSPAANVSWREYLEVDLVLIVLTSVCVVVFLLSLLIVRMVAIVMRPKLKRD